jgi:cytoskeletal protein CcmA (bactofilin family)
MFSSRRDQPTPHAVATPPGEPSPALEAPAPTRRFTDAQPDRPTTLGRGLNIRGSLAGSDSLEIGGRFEGIIEVDGLCHIGEGACVIGPVRAGDAVIEGELQGRLTVRGRVEVRATAKVRGDIEARTVALADGCFFDGHIHMTGREGAGGPTTFREKRRRKHHPPA